MKRVRWMRSAMMFLSGAVVLQIAGCAPSLLDIVQTVLLGITAAGSLAILRNL